MNRVTSTPVLTAALALALGFVPAAQAKEVSAQLRVEGGRGTVLDPGTEYRTDTIRARSSRKCGPTDAQKHKLEGPNAMGIVGDAARRNGKLTPFRVSDTFGFGLIVCEIGEFGAFGANKAWLYKVNHELPPVGADQFRLRRGDRVLWYFANFDRGANTGSELVLRAPRRVDPGASFAVRAFAFDDDGDRSPAAGVRLGGDFPNTGADGRSTGRIGDADGFIRLRGRRGNDIPTPPTVVCERGGRRCPSD